MLKVSIASIAEDLANTQTEITGIPHTYTIDVVNGEISVHELEKDNV